MPQLRKSSLGLLGFAAAVALGAAACLSNTPPSFLLTTTGAAILTQTLALDAEGAIANATTTGATAVFTDAPPVSNVGPSDPQCSTITRSPASPLDGDADGVPDSVRFTFNACVLSYPAESDTLRGVIDVLDPTLTADQAVKRVFTGMVRARLRSGKLSTETWTGTRTTTRDADTLKHRETSFRTDYTFPSGDAAIEMRTWTSAFTAEVAGSIMADQALPSGNWTFTGTSSWTYGANTYSISTTTPVALHYNASCTATPRYDLGTLKAVVTLSTQTSTVTVNFTGCGVVSATQS